MRKLLLTLSLLAACGGSAIVEPVQEVIYVEVAPAQAAGAPQRFENPEPGSIAGSPARRGYWTEQELRDAFGEWRDEAIEKACYQNEQTDHIVCVDCWMVDHEEQRITIRCECPDGEPYVMFGQQCRLEGFAGAAGK